jgi:tRNA pseudouridine(38-40) synthase
MRLGMQVIVDAAGRTDKGVSACGQVVSFHSWPEVSLEAVAHALDTACRGMLRALHVQRMPRSFHATFSVRSLCRPQPLLAPLQPSRGMHGAVCQGR